ncbi:sigma-54 interaction domain-containing protein [Desulfosediminicola sp.]|uniref:sigma-54 interaction domain-containing protein n=1 Tax=Desulfosediminicola sp. TaxID=2886825 RepID=UPI003AF21A05
MQNTISRKTINNQLEAIFASSSDGIWVCDKDGTVVRVNRASEMLNGIKEEKIIGRNIRDLVGKGVFDHSVTAKVLKSGRRETVMQYIARTKKYLLSTGTPSKDENGRISLIVVNERDITELNTLRKKFEQSRKVEEKVREELSGLSLLELQQNRFVAEAPNMRNILQMSLKLANIGASNILILGESGTGKSMLSKFIHKTSSRRSNPFVEINCAALPESLLEAELFGYEKGAFTGANEQGKIGLFEMAQGGTLFLDEIGDMPLALQAKLLKYLDNHEIRRVGGTELIQVDCSVIAATNQDLQDLVKQKRFREDLYYRLSSFILRLPPLRQRKEDIPGLVRLYLDRFNEKYSCTARVGSGAMQALMHYAFPGNIRELKNIIENSVALSENGAADEFIHISLEGDCPQGRKRMTAGSTPESFNLTRNVQELERTILLRAKQEFPTTREMAKKLGISQPSVVRKLKQYNIQ